MKIRNKSETQTRFTEQDLTYLEQSKYLDTKFIKSLILAQDERWRRA